MDYPYRKLASALFALAALWACWPYRARGDDSSERVSVKLAMDWYPNSNHTGLFIAKQRGYFEEEGLDVNMYTPVGPFRGAADGGGRRGRLRHKLPARRAAAPGARECPWCR